jgi:hypothetical protein
MKGITSKLPAGMSDYCNYIFTVGEKAGLMAKMVSDYTKKIIDGIEEVKKTWKNVYGRGSLRAIDGMHASRLAGDINKILDIIFNSR